MKIEKINDNQIRFILDEEDLKARQINLAELAYGTDKAKKLFREMMQQAQRQYGFDFTELPLMIEAIPMSGNNLVLVVTKVDNPQELDSRYANFAPSIHDSAQQDSRDATSRVLDQLFDSIRESSGNANVNADRDMRQEGDGSSTNNRNAIGNNMPGMGNTRTAGSAGNGRADRDKTAAQRREEYVKIREYIMTHRLYVFPTMDAVIAAAQKVSAGFTGTSDLLQDKNGRPYYLFLTMKNMAEVSDMQSVLAAISEYGQMEISSYARAQQLGEHCRTLITGNALQQLAGI